MKIFELFGSIFVETDQANESMDKTDSKAKGIATTLGNGIKTAGAWSAALVGGVAAAGTAMLAAGNKFAETTSNIDDMSQKLGLSREGFQEWSYMLEQSGATIDSMKAGMTKLNNSFDELKTGSGAGADAFARLGLSLDDLKGKSQEEIFEATVTALQGITDEGERAAIASDLLGKSAVELAPLLNSGAGGVEEMKKQAHELGIVLGDETIDAGVKFGDTMDQVKAIFTSMATNLMSGLMPTLQLFLDLIIDNMPMIQEVMQNVFGVLATAVQGIMPLFMQLIEQVLPPMIDLFTNLGTNLLPILIDTITKLMTSVLPVLIEVFNFLINSVLPPLVEILNVVITTVLPPLIELFTNIISAVLPVLIDLFTTITETVLPPLIELFTNIISAVLPVLIDLFTTITETVLPPLIDIFNMIIENVLPILIELFNIFVETVLPPLIEVINLIVQEILPPLLAIFMDLAEAVLPLVMEVFEAMMPVIEPIMKAIAAVIKTVLALIKGDWEGVWQGIQDFFGSILDAIVATVEGFADIFEDIFQGIADVVGGIWEGMVNGIKAGINFIIGGINSFIEGINNIKIPDWVPGVGGLSFSLPTIPMLAEGGDIIESGKILVGENGPEIFEAKAGARVTPLERYEDESSRGKGDVYQEITINSPKPLSPSETAKQFKRASRQLALEFA